MTSVYTPWWTAPTTGGVHRALYGTTWRRKLVKMRILPHIDAHEQRGKVSVTRAHRNYDIVVVVRAKLQKPPDGFGAQLSPSCPYPLPHERLSFRNWPLDGQRGYGYTSIEKFIDAARSVNAKQIQMQPRGPPPIMTKSGSPPQRTVLMTAILKCPAHT